MGRTAATILSMLRGLRRFGLHALARVAGSTPRRAGSDQDDRDFEGVRETFDRHIGWSLAILGRGKAEFQPLPRESIRGMIERWAVANLDCETLNQKYRSCVGLGQGCRLFARRGSPLISRCRLGRCDQLGAGYLVERVTRLQTGGLLRRAGRVAASGYRWTHAGAVSWTACRTSCADRNGAC